MLKEIKLSVGKAIRRIFCILLSGFVINFVMLTGLDSYSWFESIARASTAVSAASINDIIKDGRIELIYSNSVDQDRKVNPIAIKLQKAEGVNFNPTLYFSIEKVQDNSIYETGVESIEKYVFHINPVTLIESEEYIIPINLVVNFSDICSLPEKAVGVIRLKYLNCYIDEAIEVCFDHNYLLYKALNPSEIKEAYAVSADEGNIAGLVSSEIQSEDDMESSLINAIKILAGKVTWQPLQWESKSENSTVITEETMPSYVISFSRPVLSDEQSGILDIIIPGFKEYVKAMWDEIEKLVAELNAKTAELAEKDKLIAQKDQQILELKAQLEAKQSEYNTPQQLHDNTQQTSGESYEVENTNVIEASPESETRLTSSEDQSSSAETESEAQLNIDSSYDSESAEGETSVDQPVQEEKNEEAQSNNADSTELQIPVNNASTDIATPKQESIDEAIFGQDEEGKE